MGAIHAALLRGLTVDEACASAEVHRNTYTKWRQLDPEWRALVDHAKAVSRSGPGFGPGVPLWTDEVPGDFQSFVGKYFPDRNPHQFQQLQLVNALAALEPNEVCLFLIWPESGKSSTLEDYMCRKLALEPDHRFRVVSQSQDLSKNIVGMCKRRFTDTSEWGPFIGRFGPFYEQRQERSGRPWGSEEITVARARGTERDKSIVASSWSSATTGSRIDTLILDDVQTPENYGQADTIFERLRSTFFTRQLDMRVLVIGHKVGPGDVYERLEQEGLLTKHITLPAAGWNTEPDLPSVPEFWVAKPKYHTGGPCCGGLSPFRECPKDGSQLTAKEAMDLTRHRVGERAWFSMYMQDPISDHLTTFAGFLPGCLDETRSIGPLVGV